MTPFQTLAIPLWLSLASLLPSCLAAPANPVVARQAGFTASLSGSQNVFGDGTYPRANKLSNGEFLGVYTGFTGGNNVIMTVKSTDGASWESLGTVTSGASNANDIDNPYVLQLPSGRVLCAFRNHSKDPASGAYIFFRITISYSDDNGQTWKYLSTPASDPGPVNGNWEPFLRNTLSGSVQLYYSRENSAQDQDTLERCSTDGGITWSDASTISGADIISRDGMTGVATIDGSNLIAVFESESNGLFHISSITSSDDGFTWGNRQTVYTPDTSGTSAGAPQVICVGGTLAVSFMTNEDTAAPSSGYTSDTAAKLVTSPDGGSTWGNKIMVGTVQSAWPGLLQIDAQTFYYLVDHGGAKAQMVTLG
ncbi:hypothetical protein MMC06_005899 [Schaereria dolodes]|nr:hypothetical protein [Schaereria dolodes]